MKILASIIGVFSIALAFTQISQTPQSPYTGSPSLTQTHPASFSKQQLAPAGINGTIGINGIVGNPVGAVPAGQHYCKTHELNTQHYTERGIIHEFTNDYMQSAMNISPVGLDKTPGVNTISVIFHVVYNPNNPAENVSNALIMQMFNDLSEDFQLLNADAANARTGLGFIPADANINFCLATQDPSGNPLSEIGVVRVSTTEEWYDSDNGEENKMKSSATGGSQIWDRNKYLNVWICDISNGANSGVAGYAYRPTPTFLPSASIDGIVLDYNLGVNNDNVLTHETGHYLGLDHTWGGSGSCGNDDGFGDTPNTAGPSFNYPGSCSGSQSTCSGIETQYENYMDYANCTVMYTQNQADYMLMILQGIRNSLLISPGCDPTNTPPNSAFASIPVGPAPVVIPVNGGVNFIDQSTNVPTAWNWLISGIQNVDWAYTGGTNNSSQNPQVEFYNVGTYNVTLTASNAFGADPTPASEPGYVQVVAPASGTACDTLRNWDPVDADLNGYFYYLGNWGYIPGHSELGSGTNYSDQFAEKFNYVGTAEVRRLAMPFFQADDLSGSGTIVLKVWADAGTTPGAELATEVINIADIDVGFWNEFDFTTPATVTGSFWAGFEVFYGSPQDTVIVGMTETILGGNDSYYIDINGFGWYDGSALGITGSIALDVMLSNGPAPVADFTATDDQVCIGGDISVNGSASQNTTNYYWYLTDEPVTTIISSSNTPSNSYNFPTAGLYNIYLFADGSCMSDGVYLPVTVNPAVTATVTPTHTTCGNNNGIITITAPAGGDGTYYYSLDGVNYYTSNVFDNLPSGSYTVYVATFGDNCESSYTITINSSTALVASAGPNSSVCPGGTSTISASGGTSYQWYDGLNLIASTASTNVTPASTTQYTCLVTNGVGCQSTVQVTVTVNPLPAVPVITPSGATTFCAGGDVDLVSSYTTNNTWSNAQTGSTINVNSSGSYSVTYTDGNGCSSTSTPISVTVVPLPVINSGTITNPTICATSTGAIQVTGSGTGNVSWTGTNSGSATSVTLPYTISNIPAGAYNITFSDLTGCTSNTLAVGLNDPTPPATPIITASGPTTFCVGGSVNLTSSYTSGNVWSNALTSQSISATVSGTYSVTYTDINGCSSSSAPLVVTVNSNPAAPTIASSGPLAFCDGGTVTLTSSQGSGNTWSTTETTSSITVNTSDTYTVTYTNSNGCSTTSAPTTVTVYSTPSIPVITASGSTTICAGDVLTLTSSYASGNDWSTTETSASINVTNADTYFVTYTDANGCFSTSAGTTVIVNVLPAISAGADQSICEGDDVTLNASNGISYIWDNGVTDGVAFTPTATLTYTVIGTDNNGCSNTDDVVVTVNALPTVTFSSLGMICEYFSPLSLTGGSPVGGSYSGTGVTSNEFDPSVAGLGVHTITYSYTDVNNCTATATSVITVDECISLEEVELLNPVIFPNPVVDELNIETEGQMDVFVYDAAGRLLFQASGTDVVKIDMKAFESAMYQVKIAVGSLVYFEKVMKQ